MTKHKKSDKDSETMSPKLSLSDAKYFVYNGTRSVIGEKFHLTPGAIYNVKDMPEDYLSNMLKKKISKRTPEFQNFSGVVADRHNTSYVVNPKTRIKKSSLLATSEHVMKGAKISPDGYVMHETPYVGVPHYTTYEAELVSEQDYLEYKTFKETSSISSLEEMQFKYAVE